ncbi:MAG: Co2+/Mg2+ efflux protein ApaG [Bacteroidota bacterium]|jgi:ApaG protein
MTISTLITNGISVSVESLYRPEYSRPLNSHFLFSYRVTIENRSESYVQLLRRHWHIFDSTGNKSEVEGAGVIGEQPVLAPGDSYTYESACNLITDIGKMRGTYLFEKKNDNSLFEVEIPQFLLVAAFKLN